MKATRGEKKPRDAVDAQDRMIACIKDEWGYKDGDAALLEVEREKSRLQKCLVQ